MASQPIDKGVILSIKTESFNTRNRKTANSSRFNAPYTKQLLTNDRLAPTADVTVEAPGNCRLLVIRTGGGKIRINGTINGQAVVLTSGTLTVLSEAVFTGDLTITNVDTVGTSAKDVAVEAYVQAGVVT